MALKLLDELLSIFEDETISVCTWNVLAKSYCTPNYFKSSDATYLNWKNYRKSLFCSKLKQYIYYDILLFQEVDCLNDFKHILIENNYSIIYQRRGNNKADGCMIAYKKNKFKLISPIYIVQYDGIGFIINNKKYLTNNIGIIIKLQTNYINSKAKEIIIGTTHINWQWLKPDIQLLQIKSFINCIQKLKQKQNDIVIFGGDFNCDPNTIQYNFILNGFCNMFIPCNSDNTDNNEEKQSRNNISDNNDTVILNNNTIMDIFPILSDSKDYTFKHKLCLKSVYKSFFGKEPETTNHTGGYSGCLDYIFVSDKVEILNVDKINIESSNKNYLPNKYEPSDHLPIKTTVKLC